MQVIQAHDDARQQTCNKTKKNEKEKKTKATTEQVTKVCESHEQAYTA